ncbi:MAG: DUF3090 domain-containing protein [Anaerolineae bacterium]|jgi:uncharacterized repeat protein (TIGR03847 family)
MSREFYDLNPVSHITADTIGEPGKRTFYLQASQQDVLVTLVLEKEQVQALAVSIEQMLEELDKRRPQHASEMEFISPYDLALRGPVEPTFRVGQIGLGYDEDSDMLIIVVQELADTPEERSAARFWASRDQMKALSKHSLEVVQAGRPVCPLCGRPIDPDGHFCPRRNGHQ